MRVLVLCAVSHTAGDALSSGWIILEGWMADLGKMDRTWLCSVVFMDIAAYSSQSVELQMKWKQRFNEYLSEAIRDVPDSERVILDTGDGAAICFLGAPEAAMFTALQLCQSFAADERDQPPGLRVRIGINLGPVKLIKDINGALNAIGDGMNAGQRIMSFAAVNQILVSQSFFEVVSRLSDDYKKMFQLKGVEKDKHIREHTVYHLTPPGGVRVAPEADLEPAPAGRGQRHFDSRSMIWMAVGAAVVLAAGLTTWHMRSSDDHVAAVVNVPAPAVSATPESAPVAVPAPPKPAVKAPVQVAQVEQIERPAASPAERAASTPPSAEATAAFEDGMRLLKQANPTQAAQRFSDAIRIKPDYIAGYAGRAQARRQLMQYELSIADCNKIIQLAPEDARGPNCRGAAYLQTKQYEMALRDFSEAIRLKPDFELAYLFRGTAYSGLQQYERAVQDFDAALRLQPRDILALRRRGAALIALKQYDKAIEDYTQALRVDANDFALYNGRARAEQLAGDTAGASADRARAQSLRKQNQGREEE